MIETSRAKTPSPRQTRDSHVALSNALVPIVLLAVGIASGSLYVWGRDLHRFTQWLAAYIGLFIGQLGFYVVACYVVLRWADRSSRAARWATIGVVVFFAAGFRTVLVPQRPYLSSDVYRYVWDGHVQAQGVNPYRNVPEAVELSDLRDDRIYPNINLEDRRWLSPYPPVAQIVFAGVSRIRPLSVTAFKAVMSSFDLITVLLLMMVLARSGLDPARAIIFAWHPLAIFEGSHSGHIEAALIAFLALALWAWTERKYALTGIGVALATLVKFYPILLLPVFLIAKKEPRDIQEQTADKSIRGGTGRLSLSDVFSKASLTMLGAFVATVALAYLPYLGAGKNLFGFLRDYVVEEGFIQNGTRYFLLTLIRGVISMPTAVFLLLAAVGFIVVALRWLLRTKLDAVDVAKGATALTGLYLLVTTPRYPWYYILLIPYLCLAPRIGWLYLTCAAALLYLVWYTPLVYPGIPVWLGAVIYGPALALLLWERYSRRIGYP